MKVYVVTAGLYSDYHIAKVFTDKDKAEELCRCVNAQNWNWEFYVNKYTKALYDLVAIIKQKKAECASEDDIKTLMRGLGEKDEQWFN